MKRFEKIAEDTHELLMDNLEWQCRYADYAQDIMERIHEIKAKKAGFHEWAPLFVYMPVNEAKKSASTFSLRYMGQDVARLKVDSGSVSISVDADIAKNNKRDFGCAILLPGKWEDWRGKTARQFRKHFFALPGRADKSGKGNEEHRVESMFLTALSGGRGGKHPLLREMSPVKIAGVVRFQMPTPIAASKAPFKYSRKGGGIDILARVGHARNTKLCIMELKDEFSFREPPEKTIQQALAYAVFIRDLLRSSSGETWWKIFGSSGTVPLKLTLYAACVMPFHPEAERMSAVFKKGRVKIEGDTVELHYIYFLEDRRIQGIKTSFMRA